jgi:hypothetical protein
MVEAGFADGGDMALGDHQSGNRTHERNEGQVRTDGQEQDRQDQAHDSGDRADDDRTT